MSGSGSGSYQTWDFSAKILTLNQTTLIFQSSPTSANFSTSLKCTLKYQDGIPTYADYLTALIYLPPECLTESLKGNLEWATQIDTLLRTATVTNKTSQTLNFKVEAGTFQSININLSLTGIDYGTLALIYDVNSGILIHEQWTPSYGDIIILSLMATTYAPGIQQTILNLILPTATLATPVATALHQTRRILQKRSNKRTPKKTKQPKDDTLKSGFPRKPFYITLIGALLNLASVFLPWSQFAGMPIYLPLSLPLALTAESAVFFSSTSIFATISLTAHATAALVWLSIAMHIYTRRKLLALIAAVSSSMLAFISAVIYIQTDWTPSWGLPITVVGGVLTIAGIIAANIQIEIVKEEAEEPEAISTS